MGSVGFCSPPFLRWVLWLIWWRIIVNIFYCFIYIYQNKYCFLYTEYIESFMFLRGVMVMNLKYLNDDELLGNTEKLVREERRISLEILEHLREIEFRKLFLEQGYSSL